tara:strand:+ start:2949 stop:3386 length:438 start_codon:yes stop_codon:yes gene_type:complete
MIGKAIYDILANDTDVASLVGTSIFPNVNYLDDRTYPYIAYHHLAEEANDTKTGAGNSPIHGVSTLNVAKIQVNCFNKTKFQLEELAEYARIALDRNSGTYNGVKLQSIQFENQNDTFNFEGYQDFDGIFQIALIFSCRYEPYNG